MAIQLDAAWLLAVYLLACRLGGVFLLSPVLGFAALPPTIRVTIVLALSISLVSATLPAQLHQLDPLQLAALSALSFMQGAIIGSAIRAATAAFQFGGQLVDFQVGFNAAAILNPATDVQSSVIGALMEMFAALLFVLLDLHHVLLRGLAESFREAPSVYSLTGNLMQVAVQQASLSFAYGLALVMPIVVGIFLIDVTIAVISRSMPQINIYFVSLPLKVFAGLTLLAMSMRYLVPLAGRILRIALESTLPVAP